MGKMAKVALTAILVAAGYGIAKYEQPIGEVVSGLYDKGRSVVTAPMNGFYEWATGRDREATKLDSAIKYIEETGGSPRKTGEIEQNIRQKVEGNPSQ